MKYWINVFKDKKYGFHSSLCDTREEALSEIAANIGTTDDYFHTVVFNSNGVVPISTQSFYEEAKDTVDKDVEIDGSESFDYKGL